MKKNIKWLTFKTRLSSLCNWPLVLECKLDSMSSILVNLSHDLLVWLIFYVTGYHYAEGSGICPAENWIIKTLLSHWCPFLPFPTPCGSFPSLFLYIYTRIDGKVQYRPQCWLAPQERKEERWDWVEQMGEAGAYLWLTNWRLTGLGQWNPVCLWVWSVIWPFQLVFCLWVSPYFLFTVRESQSSVIQKSMLITVVWTLVKGQIGKLTEEYNTVPFWLFSNLP